MITYARKVGRLVEIRARGEHNLTNFARVIALANELGPDARVVVLSDMRGADTALPQKELEKLIIAIRSSAQRWELGVAIDRDRGSLASNAERARQRAGMPGMHVVRTEDEALVLLKPVLNPAELARAKQFLEEA